LCKTPHYGLRVTRPGDVAGPGTIEGSAYPLTYSTPVVVQSDVNWHHYAMTYDGLTLRLFLDATQTGTSNGPGSGLQNGQMQSIALTVGGWMDFLNECPDGPTRMGLIGAIDELAVFNRALAPAEITMVRDGGPCAVP